MNDNELVVRNFEREGLGLCKQCGARISIVDPQNYTFYCENKHLSEYMSSSKFAEFQNSLPKSVVVQITRKCNSCKKILYHNQPNSWHQYRSGVIFCSNCK